MTESHGSMSVGESSKLVGASNYYTWQLKMRAILRRENVWELNENHVTPAIFLAIVLGTQYSENSCLVWNTTLGRSLLAWIRLQLH